MLVGYMVSAATTESYTICKQMGETLFQKSLFTKQAMAPLIYQIYYIKLSILPYCPFNFHLSPVLAVPLILLCWVFIFT